MWNSEPPARFKRLPVLPAFMPCFGIGGGDGGGSMREPDDRIGSRGFVGRFPSFRPTGEARWGGWVVCRGMSFRNGFDGGTMNFKQFHHGS